MRTAANRRFTLTTPLVAFMVLLTSLAFPFSPAGAAPDETFADDFQSDDFGGSTGTLPWTGPWVENGESDGPGTGLVQVDDEAQCTDDVCLVLGKDSGPDASIERQADLAGFATATLAFDYTVHKHGGGAGVVAVMVSSNGGSDWTALESWPLGTEVSSAATYDITAHLATDTRIKFAVNGSTDDSHLNIDNLAVEVTYWSQQTTPTSEDLHAVQFPVDDQIGYAAGDNGTVIKTNNGGELWTLQTTPTANDLRDVVFPTDPLTGYVVGLNDTLLKTANGTSWSPQVTPTDVSLRGIDFFDSSIGFAVGDFGTILKTADGGDTWIQKPSGTGEILRDVTFGTDSQTAWAVGASGTIVKTTDGGDSWAPQVSGTGESINGIQFPVDSNNGFAVAAAGVLLTTNDGGGLWLKQTISGEKLRGLHFPQDAQHGHISAFGGYVLATEASGSTWLNEPIPTTEDLLAIWSVDLNRGWVVGRNGVIFVTGAAGNPPPTNNPPGFWWNTPDQSNSEGSAVWMPAPASDPDGDDLTFSATGLPEGISISATTGTITGALGPNSAGTHNVTLIVTDDGTPNMQDTDTFTWTVAQGEATYLIANSGGGNGGDDLLTVVNRADTNRFTNETSIGTGTGTTGIQAAALQPGTNTLFAIEGDQLGTVDVTTGEFTPKASIAGAGSGSAGLIAFDKVEGLAFNPFSGELFATHRRGGSQEDLLFKLNPVSGAHVPGAFGGDDYIAIQAQSVYYHAADLAFDPTDGQLYIVHTAAEGLWSLATLDPETGATSTLGSTLGDIASLAFDTTGDLYTSTAAGSLEHVYELDTSDGSVVSSLVIDNGSGYEAMAISLSSLPNQMPVFDQNLLNRSDIEGAAISLSAAATDPDGGDVVTYAATGLPPGLSIDTGSGLISGTIGFAASAGSPYSVIVTATDNGSPNLSVDDTFTWTVTEINRPPVFDQDLLDRSDVEGAVISLSAAATDPDGGDTLTYGATGLPFGLTIDAGSGLISGTIDYDASVGSPYSVTVTATDDGVPNEGAVPDTFAWTVSNTNRPPVATNPGPQTTPELAPFSIIVSATDPDGTVPTLGDGGTLPAWAVLTDHGDGTATIAGTPGIGDSGTTTVTVTASDGSLTDDAVFDLTVTNTNQPPAITNPGNQTTGEGTSFNLPIAGSDPDGTTVSFSDAGSLPAWASLTDNGDDTATVTGTPGFGDSGTTTVTITVSDGSLTADAVFDITVTNTNQAPVVAPIADVSVAEATALTPAGVTATDPDGTTPALAALGLPGWATFTDNGDGTGTITGTPGYTDAAITTVTVTANDGALTGFATFDLTVTNTNQPPAIDPITDVTVAEATALTPVVVTATDPDGTTPALAALGLPGWATFTDNGDGTGTITGTPGYTDAATTTITINAEDGGLPNLTAATTFDVTVTNTNQPPTVDPIADATGAEATALPPINVTATDPDGTTPALAALGLPGWATFTDNGDGTGTIIGSPGYGDAAVTTVTITASDGGLSGSNSFDLTVTDSNQTPVFDIDLGNRTDAEGVSITLAAGATDPDGDSLGYGASGLPPGLAIDPISGDISGTITYDAAGDHAVQITVMDDGVPALTATDSFVWSVTNTNQPPKLEPIPDILGEEEATITFVADATDPDGDDVVFALAGAPSGATIDPSTGAFAWTPGEVHGTGSYPVTVIATDNGTPPESSSVVATITVTEVNQAPAILPLTDQHNNEGDSVSVSITATDPDIPTNDITYAASGLPTGLSIDSASGLITGTVGLDTDGEHTVTIVATDDGSPAAAATASFKWMIGNTNRPPTVGPVAPIRAAEHSLITFAVDATDPDGDDLVFTMSGAPDGASIDAGLGTFVWRPSEKQGPGTYSFSVIVRDDGKPQLGAARTVTISVTELNEAPRIVAMGDRADDEETAVVVTVIATDPDLPANALTYSATGLPGGITINPISGVISGTIEAGDETVTHHEVSVTVTDNGVPAQQATTAFTWTLIAANVEPTNFPPSVDAIADQYSDLGTTVELQVTANDTETIEYSAVGLPPGLSIDPETGRITGILGDAAIGKHDVVITVTDTGSPPLRSAVSFSWTTTDRTAADEKVDLVVTLDDLRPPDESAEESAPARPIRRGLVVMSSAAAATTESMQLPLALLLALMAGFATVGRIGLYPLLIRGERHSGTITLYDDELGFGLVEPDGGGEQIFVHAHAFPRRQRADLGVGTRLRYRLLASDNRASAWGATMESTSE